MHPMPVRIESHAEPIPGYKLIERIGGGGFGEVWKAEAPGGLHKAMKFVYGDLQTAGDDGARAEQELKAMSRVKTVRHPYILSLERFDIIDGQLVIVMELADRNLWDRFKECRNDGLPGIPRKELLRYMEETAEALDLMNVQYQLQHLDIKPQNIFLTHNHIKVADFGLVKDLEGMVASVTGGVTPVYAAPETFDGYVSRFCDQYSLAIVYQELLTGQRPFNGTNVRQLILQHLQGVPNLQSLPESDREAVAKALSKNPEERHKNCMDLVRLLRGRSTASPARAPAAKPAEEPPSANDSMLSQAMSDLASAVAPVLPAKESRRNALTSTPIGALDGASQPSAITQRVRPSELARASQGAPVAAVPPPAPASEAVPFNQTREAAGNGILAPTLVIGLGHHGLTVLRQLREEVRAHFGATDAVSSLRVLYIDTDPKEMREALRGRPATALQPAEALLVRLNRPSHYLKARDGREERKLTDGWFDNQMLYRIPRTQLTTGLRALGRLAFCDNYPIILRRLREELKACGTPECLAASDRATGLGIRRYRPRVYIVTSLAGGTGGGMFLDVAYVVRHLLRELGLGEPDVVGLCFLPAVSSNTGQAMALANTYAALKELCHFAGVRQAFVARYEEKESPLRDAAPPFNRCVMLPLPEEGSGGGPTTTAGQLLFRELASPMGRIVDQRRSELAPSHVIRDPSCQTFGLYCFTFPRGELVRQVARRLSHRLVERWMSKDSKPKQEPVQAWVQEQWSSQELGAECFIAALQEQLTRRLGQSPEAAFSAVMQTILALSNEEIARAQTPAPVQPEMALDVLKMLEELLGRPDQDALSQQPARIPDTLREAAAVLVAQWGDKLSALVAQLVEEPQYRLAGAEEANRQITARIERVLETHEPLGKDLAAKSLEARQRILNLLRAFPTLPSPKARAAAGDEVMDLLRNYPKWRCQSLVLQEVGRSYVSLRGELSDQLRELNFCRVRLGELLQAFEDAQQTEPPTFVGAESTAAPLVSTEPVRHLFPAGSRTLPQAVAQFTGQVTPDDFQQLDQQMQAVIEQQFRALIHVCMTPANLLKNVQAAMEEEMARTVEARIGPSDTAALFLEHYARNAEAADALSTAFDEAAPDLAGLKSGQHRNELCILAVPPGEAGDHIKMLAKQALPDVAWTYSVSVDDILVYREALQLPISELAQLGPLPQQAYRQMAAIEHFTPHTRIDIAFGEVARAR
jgi:serine/threonine protein kinase